MQNQKESKPVFEINLKPWERMPENFDALAEAIRRGSYLPMPERPETGTFYRLYPEGCVSGNGTAYHGGIRIGEEADKLLIYFNGGGVSFDEYTAARPWNLFTLNADEKDTYYSNDGEWTGDYFLSKGLNARRDDNPFLKWSCINLLYCNGDFHSGDGEFEYTAQDGSRQIMPYHGYRNAMATIRLAMKYLPSPTTIVIAGSSAGGFWAAMLAEDIIGLFPECGNITLAVDSSLIVSDRWKDVAEHVWHTPEHIRRRLVSGNIILDCMVDLYKKHGNHIKYLFLCSVRDALLTVAQNAIDGKGQTHTLADGIAFEERLQNMCADLRNSIPEIGLFVFSAPMDAPGYDADRLTLHCILNNPFLFDLFVGDMNASEWLMNAVNGTIDCRGMELLEKERE